MKSSPQLLHRRQQLVGILIDEEAKRGRGADRSSNRALHDGAVGAHELELRDALWKGYLKLYILKKLLLLLFL